MINVKEATDKAREYLVSFFPDAEKVQLEEIELTEDKEHWFITLSYEGVSNSVASVTEDVAVVGILWMVLNHPILAILVVIALVAFSIWLIPKLFRFVKKVFLMVFGRKSDAAPPNT